MSRSVPGPAISLPPERNLVLVGYRGAGKTRLGREVAAQLRRPFFDLDTEIEFSQGRSIASIFETEGEEAFRELEQGSLSGVLQRKGLVVSPGGGVVLREENRVLLRAQLTVYLQVEAGELIRRLRPGPDRPPLTEQPFEQEVLSTLAARERYYREVSSLVLSVPAGEELRRSSRRLLDLLAGSGQDGV